MILFNTPTDSKTAGQKTSVVGGILNFFLAIIQLVVGLISGSAALTADSFHTLADLGSDVVTYLAVSIGHNDADDTHLYGHGKFESIGVMVLSMLLAVAAISITAQAIGRFFSDESVALGPLPLAIAFITLLAKEGMFRYTKHWGEKFKSKVIIMNAWHHRSDSLSSAIVFLAIGLNMIGLQFFDALAALFITFMLLRMSWNNGKEAFNELVDAAVEEDILKEINKTILATPGVSSCHYLRARRMGGDIYLDVHIEVAPYISVSEGHSIGDAAEHALKSNIEGVVDVTVHVDPYADENVTYTSHPAREELEKNLLSVLKTKAPDVKLVKLILHTLPEELSAEVTIEGELTDAQAQEIKKVLTLPQGPFHKTSFFKKIA